MYFMAYFIFFLLHNRGYGCVMVMCDAHQTSWRCELRSGCVPVSTNPLVQLGIMDFVNLRLGVITGQCSSCILHNGSFSFYALVLLQSCHGRVNENEQQTIQCRVFQYGKDIFQMIYDSTYLLVGLAVTCQKDQTSQLILFLPE